MYGTNEGPPSSGNMSPADDSHEVSFFLNVITLSFIDKVTDKSYESLLNDIIASISIFKICCEFLYQMYLLSLL